MKYLVADDDPLVCETVEAFLGRIEDTEFCLKASDGLTALQLLSTGGLDAVFLDLQMPQLDGPAVLRALPRDLPVVVVSASADFGAQSYEFQVLDYLLKPLNFERFAQAVARIRERLQRKDSGIPVSRPTPREIFVKDGTRLVRIALDEVLFVKAEANYVEFVTPTSTVLSLMALSRLEEQLPAEFVRVHRSHVVNLHHITRIEGATLIVGKHHLPIGESYREALWTRLPMLK